MKNLIKVIIAFFIINSSLSNHLNAQTKLVISGNNIVMQGDYLILENTKLTNNSTFYSGSGTVVISGDASDANTTIGGSSLTTFYNLQINKTANGAQLENDIDISNQLTLTNGNIDIANYDLTIQNTASISGGSANSYVKTSNLGTVIQEVSGSNVVFPVGNQSYTPVTLNNGGTTDDFYVRVENVVYTNGTSGDAITTDVVNATWFIDEGTEGGSDVSATFQWNAADELPDFDRTQAFISHYDHSMWNNGTASTASGSNPYTLTESNITTFSPFIVASDAAVLPVELLYFYGKKEGENVRLDWQTATEINNSHFDVEWSIDGISFEKIGEIAGVGTTNEVQSYDFLHLSPILGENYYRLKQVDFDKKYEYTDILSVNYNLGIKNYELKIFPNPAANFIAIDGIEEGEIIQIFNVNGQLAKTFYQNVSTQQTDISDLTSGIYFVKTGKQVKKLIIGK